MGKIIVKFGCNKHVCVSSICEWFYAFLFIMKSPKLWWICFYYGANHCWLWL